MKWSDIKGDQISVIQEKTGKALWIPLHAGLRSLLPTIERRSEFILTTTRGKAWATGFDASWRKAMAKPEMKALKDERLVFHGLRKSAVVFLLEAGCTDAEVAAITGQTRQMIEQHALKVNRKSLAASAILKWGRDTDENDGPET